MLFQRIYKTGKIFLENAEVAMEPAKVVKGYKEEITNLQSQVDRYTKTVGKPTMEKAWLEGHLEGLDLSSKKKMTDFSLRQNINPSKAPNSNKILQPNIVPSLLVQCKLLKVNRSSLYYAPSINEKKTSIQNKINDMGLGNLNA